MELRAGEQRLKEARAGVPWRRWGPYLSERQWGTVREDYSDDGNAWNYEYYHGGNGAGLGASHQTGWSGVVARLIQLSGYLDADSLLGDGGRPLARPFRLVTGEPVADAATARAARGVRS